MDAPFRSPIGIWLRGRWSGVEGWNQIERNLVYPSGNVADAQRAILKIRGGIVADYQMTLVDRQRVARGTMTFWFDANGSEYDFRAGQHADFAFLHPSVGNESDNLRTFSLANSPHDTGLVMIAMRMRETRFKTALMSAALGTKFRVSRPRGSFTLHKDSARPAVFLAGGIGITPVRSILEWATQERMPHKLYLFYSNREAVDAAFLEEFETLAVRNPRFTLIPTITRLTYSAWRYEVGHINRQLLSRYLTGLNRPVFYIAGPSGMVTAMTNLLRSLDVSDDDIRTEEFGDYKVTENPVRRIKLPGAIADVPCGEGHE